MTSLGVRLRTRTADLHRQAERSGFMSAMLRGKVSLSAYCGYLRNLHAIYSVLEIALERHRLHPVLAPIFLPALWRTRALSEDLDLLHGPNWRDDLALQPTASAYVARLETVSEHNPAALLGHAYVRFLGDLSGGQVLRKLMLRILPERGGRGLAFYDFGDAAQTQALTDAFRSGLESGASPEPVAAVSGAAAPGAAASGADVVVDEAVLAFEFHAALFDELALAFRIPPNESGAGAAPVEPSTAPAQSLPS